MLFYTHTKRRILGHQLFVKTMKIFFEKRDKFDFFGIVILGVTSTINFAIFFFFIQQTRQILYLQQRKILGQQLFVETMETFFEKCDKFDFFGIVILAPMSSMNFTIFFSVNSRDSPDFEPLKRTIPGQQLFVETMETFFEKRDKFDFFGIAILALTSRMNF